MAGTSATVAPSLNGDPILVVGVSRAGCLETCLRDGGARVVAVSSLREARAFVATECWAAIVLSVELADAQHSELLLFVKALELHAPLIVLSNNLRDWTRLRLLRAYGAVPLEDPFTQQQLLEAIEDALKLSAKMRASSPSSQEPLSGQLAYGPIALRLATDEVFVDGLLRPKVKGILYRLLRYMTLHPETELTHEDLEREVWGARVAKRTVESHLSRLRAGLGTAGSLIVTLRSGCGIWKLNDNEPSKLNGGQDACGPRPAVMDRAQESGGARKRDRGRRPGQARTGGRF